MYFLCDLVLDNSLTQHYCCLVIPHLVTLEGAPWDVLPEGIYLATLAEISYKFAINPRRRDLFNGLISALRALTTAGCASVYLDGSFVTGKPMPGDYDVCWVPTGVDPYTLDPVFLDFTNKRAKQKKKYLGEFFPSTATNKGQPFIEFFQIEKYTGKKKGILEINLLRETF